MKTDRAPRPGTYVYITIPEHIHLYVGVSANGEVVEAWEPGDPDFDVKPEWETRKFQFVRDFVRRMLLVDPSWGKSMDGLYSAMELRSSFHEKAPGDVVRLTVEDHAALLAIVKAPTKGYSTAVAVHFAPWFRALSEPGAHPPANVADHEEAHADT